MRCSTWAGRSASACACWSIAGTASCRWRPRLSACKVQTSDKEIIEVRLNEIDHQERVMLVELVN